MPTFNGTTPSKFNPTGGTPLTDGIIVPASVVRTFRKSCNLHVSSFHLFGPNQFYNLSLNKLGLHTNITCH